MALIDSLIQDIGVEGKVTQETVEAALLECVGTLTEKTAKSKRAEFFTSLWEAILNQPQGSVPESVIEAIINSIKKLDDSEQQRLLSSQINLELKNSSERQKIKPYIPLDLILFHGHYDAAIVMLRALKKNDGLFTDDQGMRAYIEASSGSSWLHITAGAKKDDNLDLFTTELTRVCPQHLTVLNKAAIVPIDQTTSQFLGKDTALTIALKAGRTASVIALLKKGANQQSLINLIEPGSIKELNVGTVSNIRKVLDQIDDSNIHAQFKNSYDSSKKALLRDQSSQKTISSSSSSNTGSAAGIGDNSNDSNDAYYKNAINQCDSKETLKSLVDELVNNQNTSANAHLAALCTMSEKRAWVAALPYGDLEALLGKKQSVVNVNQLQQVLNTYNSRFNFFYHRKSKESQMLVRELNAVLSPLDNSKLELKATNSLMHLEIYHVLKRYMEDTNNSRGADYRTYDTNAKDSPKELWKNLQPFYKTLDAQYSKVYPLYQVYYQKNDKEQQYSLLKRAVRIIFGYQSDGRWRFFQKSSASVGLADDIKQCLAKRSQPSEKEETILIYYKNQGRPGSTLDAALKPLVADIEEKKIPAAQL